tara:strand:+ start:31 stop:216 length:186 start_codon:yes stop_codon:yes gene_type:complete
LIFDLNKTGDKKMRHEIGDIAWVRYWGGERRGVIVRIEEGHVRLYLHEVGIIDVREEAIVC